MKKVLLIILAVILTTSIAIAAPASQKIQGVFSAISVLMNGQKTSADSITYKDGMYIKTDSLSKLFNKDITWDKKKNSLSIKDSLTIKDSLNKSNPIVTMEMKSGEKVIIELYPEIAPNTVNNFIALANKGFYDGLTFHRIIPGFVIQGGDPNGDGSGGPGYAIKGEFLKNGFKNDLMHTTGVISMARTMQPDSAGSQFFIMLADNHQLNGEYAGFGKVIKGIEIVEKIGSAERDSNDKPKEPQTIKTIRVDIKGKKAQEPQVIK